MARHAKTKCEQPEPKAQCGPCVRGDSGSGHFDSALIADNSFVADALVFTTVTFPVFDRTKNFLVEKPVFFRTLGAVVDGFRFGDFAVRPIQNICGEASLSRTALNSSVCVGML
jgi:hypothetical protein